MHTASYRDANPNNQMHHDREPIKKTHEATKYGIPSAQKKPTKAKTC